MALALEIKNLYKQYGKFEALRGVDLAVASGEFFALLGPNGAGKSTIINILCSLVNKTAGTVKINGVDIDKDASLAKSYIGVVPQEFNFSIFETPLQILIYQAGYYGIPRTQAKVRAQKYLQLLQLWEKRNVEARRLSGGMKRRLMIARALMHEPKILILDEPTAGVDIEIRHAMWQFLQNINKEGVTIILTTHYLEEAENLCEKVAIIREGKIVECAPMKTIIKQMEHNVMLVEFSNKLPDEATLSPLECKRLDDYTLEVVMPKKYSLNDLFAIIMQTGWTAVDIRNKSNRLEQLFLQLTS